MFALMLRAEVKPARLLRSKLTASWLPYDRKSRGSAANNGLAIFPQNLARFGDQAKDTDGAKLFQSCL